MHFRVPILIFTLLFSLKIGYSQCDDILCNEECVQLDITYSDLPPFHCNGSPLEILINSNGGDLGNAIIRFRAYINDESSNSAGFFPGSGTSTSLEINFNNFCEPTEYLITLDVTCSSDFFIRTDTLGVVIVFPSLNFVTPTIIQPDNCGDPYQIVPPICGQFSTTIDQVIYPECGSNGQDQVIDWNIDLGFDISGIDCYTEEDLSGQLVIEACDSEIGEICIHPCLGAGQINSECECVAFETPILVPSSFVTGAYCSPTNVDVSFDVIGLVPQGGVELVISLGDFVYGGLIISQNMDLPLVRPIVFNLLGCDALFNQNIYAYLRCPQTFAYLSDPILIGNVDAYPDPTKFDVVSIEDQGCGQLPKFELNCGSLSIIEFIPPSEDCSNLTAGNLNWTIDPGFDITNAPECFGMPSGNFPIQPCDDLCPCPSLTFCGDIPINLLTSFDNVPETICSNEFVGIDWNVNGEGVDQAQIILELFDVDRPLFSSSQFSPGDPNSIFTPIRLINDGCEPIEQFINYKIRCTNTLLTEGQIGPITVLPDINKYLPQAIIEPSQCGLPFQIIPPICGNLITDPIPEPNCVNNSIEHIINWSVDVPFDIPFDLEMCFNLNRLSGQIIIPACNIEVGDMCSDPCMGDGVIDSNCNCVFNNPPLFQLSNSIEGDFCSSDGIDICFDVSGFFSNQGYFIEILDQNMNNLGFVLAFNSFPQICGDFTIRSNSCQIETFDLSYRVFCNDSQTYITGIEPLGSVDIYPFFGNFSVVSDNGFSCGQIPELISNCGDISIVEIVEPVNGPNGSDGSIEFIFDYGFDLTQAPDCFDVLGGNGTFTYVIEACEECGSHGTLIIRAVEQGN